MDPAVAQPHYIQNKKHEGIGDKLTALMWKHVPNGVPPKRLAPKKGLQYQLQSQFQPHPLDAHIQSMPNGNCSHCTHKVAEALGMTDHIPLYETEGLPDDIGRMINYAKQQAPK
jgi:hypothetical protein